MEPIKVVIRYADGRIIKGYTNDFFPNKPMFHIRPVDSEPAHKGTEIIVAELKAVFFVKDFAGNPAYDERKHFIEGQTISGRKIEVTFKDKEVLVGTTLGYDPQRIGFFIIPADPDSNNIRAFAVITAVSNFRYL